MLSDFVDCLQSLLAGAQRILVFIDAHGVGRNFAAAGGALRKRRFVVKGQSGSGGQDARHAGQLPAGKTAGQDAFLSGGRQQLWHFGIFLAWGNGTETSSRSQSAATRKNE